jgi:hypothetical protein
MPKSALPEHLNTEEKIDLAFPDDSQYGTKTLFGKLYRWLNKSTKTWFAFSYRCTEWWAKCRKTPRILFAYFGEGSTRLESSEGHGDTTATPGLWWWKHDVSDFGFYMSRVQYYCRWHFAVQLVVWRKLPLVVPMISFHFYPKAIDVPKYRRDFNSKALKGKVWFVYWNHFDADCVYWLVTSAYAGKNWK